MKVFFHFCGKKKLRQTMRLRDKKLFINPYFWCGQRDSNFHGNTPTWPSTKPVYQFQHSHKVNMRQIK